MQIQTIEPAAVDRAGAANYVGLSLTSFEKAVREGRAPAPRMIGPRRVVWLVRELRAWLDSLPISELLPPPNTGAAKPRASSMQRVDHA